MPADRPRPAKWRRLWRRRLRRRPLLPFLLAATLAVDAVVLLTMWGDTGGPDFLMMSLLGVMFGQVNLLGFWVAASPRGVAVRFSIGLVATLGLAALLEAANADPFGVFIAFLFAVMLASTLLGAIVHWTVSRWSRGLRKRRHFRFSIALLLLVSTLVPAVVMISEAGRWTVLLDPGVAVAALAETTLVVVLLALSVAMRSTNKVALAYAAFGILCVGFASSISSNVPITSPAYFLGLIIGVGGFLLGLRTDVARRSQRDDATDPTSRAEAEVDAKDDPWGDSEADKRIRYDAAHPSVLKMHIDLTG